MDDRAVIPDDMFTAIEGIKEQNKQMVESVSQSSALAQLAKQPGWEMIEKLINQQIDVLNLYPIDASQSKDFVYFRVLAHGMVRNFGESLINLVKMAVLGEEQRARQQQ
jgi:hypothetical protein